ncbi:hypothetical protein DL98DRAFT_202360 [Cadophora sp. DSE1049]|nr:hypothetical protein DL98DRAFT_202360 [Cadophora sp. DSE1049]
MNSQYSTIVAVFWRFMGLIWLRYISFCYKSLMFLDILVLITGTPFSSMLYPLHYHWFNSCAFSHLPLVWFGTFAVEHFHCAVMWRGAVCIASFSYDIRPRRLFQHLAFLIGPSSMCRGAASLTQMGASQCRMQCSFCEQSHRNS